jgi:hypothetical protein
VLTAASAVREPFAVINADDFYGQASFQTLGEYLQTGSPDYAMVGFVLRNTLSEFGSVARGVCRLTRDECLESVVELTKIEKDGDAARHTSADGKIHPLTGEEIVSLNMWGFTPTLFDHLRREFAIFLQQEGANPKAEFFIPTVVNTLINRGQVRLKVLRSTGSWFGVTYREDRPRVVASIRELIQHGDYPEKLWL